MTSRHIILPTGRRRPNPSASGTHPRLPSIEGTVLEDDAAVRERGEGKTVHESSPVQAVVRSDHRDRAVGEPLTEG